MLILRRCLFLNNKMNRICLLLVCIFNWAAGFSNVVKDSIVNQSISYTTDYASEVYLVWAVNNWLLPSDGEIPKKSFIKDGMVYSLMEASGDTFNIVLPLKEKTYLHFEFWLSKDKANQPSQNWDNFYGSNYFAFTKKGSLPRNIISTYYDRKNWGFNVFDKGWWFGVAGLFILLFSLILYRRNLRFIESSYLIGGFLFSAFIIMLFVRIQMNKLFLNSHLAFGASFYDFIFLFVFGLISISVVTYFKKKYFNYIFTFFCLVLITFFVIFSLVNIEIVDKIGRSLNYQWFYYSGFLRSADAKNSLAKEITPQITNGILFIIVCLLTAGTGLALLSDSLKSKVKWSYIITIAFLTFGITGYVQSKNNNLTHKKTENPVVSFVSSWINSRSIPELFTMQIAKAKRDSIAALYHHQADEEFSSFPGIKHLIIFVLESTPAEYIDIYNNKYSVTPQLNKWQQYSRIYLNMYAMVPATHNSLFALVSGVTPPINYRSVVEEHPDFPVISIASLLKKQQWQSSMFSAADLNFANMQKYLQQQEFDTTKDTKNIECDKQSFVFNYADMDGIDDKCMVTDFSFWLSDRKSEKTFSILWTMQTHHPYCINEKELNYVKDNPDLNRYLNALHHDDEAFGELMANLQQQEILNETIVIVIGDHGEAFGRHNQFTHASGLYEENLHIPCLLINPVIFKGEKDNRICSLPDIPATIANITGNKIPKSWQGRSLFDPKPKMQVFSFNPYTDYLFATRNGNWKLIFNASTNSFELYDLLTDPNEQSNISSTHTDVVRHEFENLAAWAQYQNAQMERWLKR